MSTKVVQNDFTRKILTPLQKLAKMWATWAK